MFGHKITKFDHWSQAQAAKLRLRRLSSNSKFEITSIINVNYPVRGGGVGGCGDYQNDMYFYIAMMLWVCVCVNFLLTKFVNKIC